MSSTQVNSLGPDQRPFLREQIIANCKFLFPASIQEVVSAINPRDSSESLKVVCLRTLRKLLDLPSGAHGGHLYQVLLDATSTMMFAQLNDSTPTTSEYGEADSEFGATPACYTPSISSNDFDRLAADVRQLQLRLDRAQNHDNPTSSLPNDTNRLSADACGTSISQPAAVGIEPSAESSQPSVHAMAAPNNRAFVPFTTEIQLLVSTRKVIIKNLGLMTKKITYTSSAYENYFPQQTIALEYIQTALDGLDCRNSRFEKSGQGKGNVDIDYGFDFEYLLLKKAGEMFSKDKELRAQCNTLKIVLERLEAFL